MRKMKLVMVGNGMAGVRTLEELLRIAPDLYDITVFGAEPHPNYNRILLSPVLAGEQTIDEIILNPLDWYAGHGITCTSARRWSTSTAAAASSRAADGTEAEYDRLLLATGSNPFIPPLPGQGARGRDRLPRHRRHRDDDRGGEDAPPCGRRRRRPARTGGGQRADAPRHGGHGGAHRALADGAPARRDGRRDAAEVARGAGPALPDRRRDRGAGRRRLPAGSRRCSFKDGSEEPADLVVMAAGIRPNTLLAEKIGLHCNRGIVVNDTMQTITDGRIYAVGECAAHRGIAYGLVAPLFEQAKVCATHLGEFGIGRYLGSQTSTKLKVTGIDLFSAGEFMGGGDDRGDRPQRPLQQRLQEARRQGRQADRRLPLRRHRRRLVVLRPGARGPQHRRHPRPADVRPAAPRRHRPRRQQPRRGDGRHAPRSAAATG